MAKASKKQRTVVKAALKVLRLDQLNVDPSYQRGVKGKVGKIVSEFNEDALGLPVIGERSDGSLWIVDGLQRITALRKMERREVRAEVFASQGAEHEAEIFKLINLNRAKLTPAEEFRALLTAHDEAAWEIKGACESEGFTIETSKTGRMPERRATQLTAINTLRMLHREWGTDPIRFALRVIKTIWPGDPIGSHYLMVEGLGRLWNRMDGAVDLERLASRLLDVTPQKVIYTAQQSASISSGGTGARVTDVIEKLYRRRNASKRPAPKISPLPNDETRAEAKKDKQL